MKRCADCGGPAVRTTRFAGRKVTRYACAPYCRINNLINAARSPIDEFDYLLAGPTPFEPGDYDCDEKRSPILGGAA